MLVLVETNDLGSALLYFGIFLAMLYVATAPAAVRRDRLALFLAGAYVVYTQVSHVHERVTIWLHPWTDHKVFCPLNGTAGAAAGLRQLPARQVALLDRERRLRRHRASARARSRRPDGHQLIPYLNTDFIYSALAQELGLIGVAGAAARLHALRPARHAGSRCSPMTASRSCSPPGSPSASRCRRSSSSAASCG